jgi:hypothetical protein
VFWRAFRGCSHDAHSMHVRSVFVDCLVSGKHVFFSKKLQSLKWLHAKVFMPFPQEQSKSASPLSPPQHHRHEYCLHFDGLCRSRAGEAFASFVPVHPSCPGSSLVSYDHKSPKRLQMGLCSRLVPLRAAIYCFIPAGISNFAHVQPSCTMVNCARVVQE